MVCLDIRDGMSESHFKVTPSLLYRFYKTHKHIYSLLHVKYLTCIVVQHSPIFKHNAHFPSITTNTRKLKSYFFNSLLKLVGNLLRLALRLLYRNLKKKGLKHSIAHINHEVYLRFSAKFYQTPQTVCSLVD